MIEIQDIRKEYEGSDVLTGITEKIHKGEIFALIGPSGQGKTTLLRIINLLEKPTSGTIRFDGMVMNQSENPDLFRRRMGMVFQNPVAFKDSVFNNIALGLRYRRFSKEEIYERVIKKINEIGLSGYEHRMALTLSGGEKQRVSLARIMVTNPDLLILDEPTANLDPVSTEVIENLIRYYNRELGTTIIFSTHDLIQGQRLAGRVAVMMKGRFIQSGSIFDVFTRPCSTEVAQFIGMGNIRTGRVIRNEAGMAVISVHGVEIHSLGEREQGMSVSLAIRPEEITIHTGSDEKTSARNVIAGMIESVRPAGIISLVNVVSGSLQLSVQVTWQSVNELNLKPGTPVRISFKAPSVYIIPDTCSHAGF